MSNDLTSLHDRTKEVLQAFEEDPLLMQMYGQPLLYLMNHILGLKGEEEAEEEVYTKEEIEIEIRGQILLALEELFHQIHLPDTKDPGPIELDLARGVFTFEVLGGSLYERYCGDTFSVKDLLDRVQVSIPYKWNEYIPKAWEDFCSEIRENKKVDLYDIEVRGSVYVFTHQEWNSGVPTAYGRLMDIMDQMERSDETWITSIGFLQSHLEGVEWDEREDNILSQILTALEDVFQKIYIPSRKDPGLITWDMESKVFSFKIDEGSRYERYPLDQPESISQEAFLQKVRIYITAEDNTRMESIWESILTCMRELSDEDLKILLTPFYISRVGELYVFKVKHW